MENVTAVKLWIKLVPKDDREEKEIWGLEKVAEKSTFQMQHNA